MTNDFDDERRREALKRRLTVIKGGATDWDPDDPPLHQVRATRVPRESWTPSGFTPLTGWCNVRIWSYDERLGRNLYVTEPCPGILHRESRVTETVLQLADPDGNLWNEYGDEYDSNPTLIATSVADPPHQLQDYVDPEWQPAIVGGGYLESCPEYQVHDVLREHGFADAIPKPAGWTHPEDDGAFE